MKIDDPHAHKLVDLLFWEWRRTFFVLVLVDEINTSSYQSCWEKTGPMTLMKSLLFRSGQTESGHWLFFMLAHWKHSTTPVGLKLGSRDLHDSSRGSKGPLQVCSSESCRGPWNYKRFENHCAKWNRAINQLLRQCLFGNRGFPVSAAQKENISGWDTNQPIQPSERIRSIIVSPFQFSF